VSSKSVNVCVVASLLEGIERAPFRRPNLVRCASNESIAKFDRRRTKVTIAVGRSGWNRFGGTDPGSMGRMRFLRLDSMRGGLLRVEVGLETTDEEIQALEHVFRWAEIPVVVEEEIARFSVDSPWVMYLSAPLAWFSSRFVRTARNGGGEPVWPGLESFIEQVREAFRTREGSVVFTDDETDVMIALTPELPAQAYSELLELDLPKVEGQRISWDSDEQAWFSLRGEPCPKR
jgi:hypothetical protein